MDDVRAVMDAAGSERAAVFGASEGGVMSMLFAATYPERTQALVLCGTYAHYHSYVLPPEAFEAFLERVEKSWGTGASLAAFAPSKVSDQSFRQWWARFERMSASPSAVLALMRLNSGIDVRHVLPSIRTPTLVLHRVGDPRVSVEGGRHLAANIPGAKLVELPGNDHLLWAGDVDRLADEMEIFLTGSRADIEPDRILATVMFTDIVDSTKRALKLGDRRWRELLDQHDRLLRQEIARFRGREVKTARRRVPRDLRRTGARGPLRHEHRRRRALARPRCAGRRAYRRDRGQGRRYRRDCGPYRGAGGGPCRIQSDPGLKHRPRSCRRVQSPVRRSRPARAERPRRTRPPVLGRPCQGVMRTSRPAQKATKGPAERGG